MQIHPEILLGNDGIEVSESADGVLELRQPWLDLKRRWTTFGVFQAGLLGVLMLMTLPDSWHELLPVGLLWPPLGYALATLFLNSTHLRIKGDEMRWKHGPLPWRRGGRVMKSEIEAITYGRRRRPMSQDELARQKRMGNQKPVYFGVDVRMRDGEKTNIFDSMKSEWTAEMTARVLARTLGGVAVEEKDTHPSQISERAAKIILIAGLLGFAALVTLLVLWVKLWR